MRILLINNSHYINGGADRVYFNTGKLLEDRGHDVMYFSTLNKKNSQNEFSKYFVEIRDNRENNIIKKIAGVKDYIFNKNSENNLKGNKIVVFHGLNRVGAKGERPM